ncbi:hypothetical protein HZS_264, partial [Henneguya salminicola]
MTDIRYLKNLNTSPELQILEKSIPKKKLMSECVSKDLKKYHAIKVPYSEGGCKERLPSKTDTNPSHKKIANFLSSVQDNMHRRVFIISILEGKGNPLRELGLAIIDLSGYDLILAQFHDTATFSRLLTVFNIYPPSEILLPHAGSSGYNKTIVEVLSSKFSEDSIISVHKKYFNEKIGRDLIAGRRNSENTQRDLDTNSRYTTLFFRHVRNFFVFVYTQALFKYLENVYNLTYFSSSLKISFYNAEKLMCIDYFTSSLLELTKGIQDTQQKTNLFDAINKTHTSGGGTNKIFITAMLLRSSLLQPHTDENKIKDNLDFIQEMIQNPKIFNNICSLLKKLIDVDKLIFRLICEIRFSNTKYVESRINSIIYLKHTLELLPSFVENLEHFHCTIAHNLIKGFSDPKFDFLIKTILDVIHLDTNITPGLLNMRTQRVFSIKPNINGSSCLINLGMLDIARRTYIESVDDITVKWYFSQIIMKGRVNESLNEICYLSDEICSELLASIRNEITCIFKVSEAFATIDMLTSLATLSLNYKYGSFYLFFQSVRPVFGEETEIRDAVHPLLTMKNKANNEVIQNDVFLTEKKNILFFTGPNMSGKTTYLKMVGILHIMAQMGCFVPCSFAKIRLCDQIFTRMANNDDLENNISTFTMEMTEMSYMMQNMTDKSLLLIDELGRGTSTRDGMSICYSFLEFLTHKKVFTLFSTHYHDLCFLANFRENILNLQFTEIDKNCKNNNYKIQQGTHRHAEYGFNVDQIIIGIK